MVVIMLPSELRTGRGTAHTYALATGRKAHLSNFMVMLKTLRFNGSYGSLAALYSASASGSLGTGALMELHPVVPTMTKPRQSVPRRKRRYAEEPSRV